MARRSNQCRGKQKQMSLEKIINNEISFLSALSLLWLRDSRLLPRLCVSLAHATARTNIDIRQHFAWLNFSAATFTLFAHKYDYHDTYLNFLLATFIYYIGSYQFAGLFVGASRVAVVNIFDVQFIPTLPFIWIFIE